MKFQPRTWTPEEAADIIRRHLAGESNSAIGRAHGNVAHSTIARLLKQPEMQTIIEEHRAAEREATAKIKKSERDKRYELRKAGHPTSPQEFQNLKRTGDVSATGPRSRPSADGRILGVYSYDNRLGVSPDFRGITASDPKRAAEVERELDALERKLVQHPLASVRVGTAQRSFDVYDDEDRRRTAAWIVDWREDLNSSDVLKTLSTIRPGATFIFPPVAEYADDEHEAA